MNEQKHIIIKDSHSTFILPQTCLALPIFDNQGGEEEVEEEEVDADAEENQWKYYAKSTRNVYLLFLVIVIKNKQS